MFSNVAEVEYERARHNVWNDEAPNEATEAFYGTARVRAHAEFLDRNPPVGNRRLLDVGCGLGFFLARAQERGWDVHGIDTSAAWVEHANSLLGSERVELATVERASFAPESFALVTAWDVIEHVFDPVPFLARMRELAAPDGRVFLRTPNLAYVYPVYAIRSRLLGHDVELGPMNHVVYFSARTMRDALSRAGLRPDDWSVYVPPQVAPAGAGRLIAVKNSYARVADLLARATCARLVVGSDLDVMAVPVTGEGSLR